MKKNYIEPFFELIELQKEDVLSASGDVFGWWKDEWGNGNPYTPNY